jgi:hypothetical protein
VVLDVVFVAAIAEQPAVPVVAGLAAEIHIVVAEMLQKRDVVAGAEMRLVELLAVQPELELVGRLASDLVPEVVAAHQSCLSLLFLFFAYHAAQVGVELPVVERLVVAGVVMLPVRLVVLAGQPELLVGRLVEQLFKNS